MLRGLLLYFRQQPPPRRKSLLAPFLTSTHTHHHPFHTTSTTPSSPPQARGDTTTSSSKDPYAWLEAPNSTEVLQHLDAENRFTSHRMRPTRPLQETLFNEMYAYLKQESHDDEASSSLLLAEAGGDGYLYYSRRPAGCNFPVYFYRRCQGEGEGEEGPPKAGEEMVLLDQNTFPEMHQRMQLGDMKVAPQHDFLAFTLADPEGMEEGGTLYLQKLSSSSADATPPSWWTVDEGAWKGVGTFEWGPPLSSSSSSSSSQHRHTHIQALYYTKMDPHGRPHQVWMAELQPKSGQLIHHPRLLFALPEEDVAFFVSLAATKDKEFVTLSINSKSASEVYLLPGSASASTATSTQRDGNDKNLTPRCVRPRQPGVQYFVDHGGDQFYIITNEGGEENGGGEYTLMTCPTNDTSKWTRVYPCPTAGDGADIEKGENSSNSSSTIEDMDLFQHHCVLYERVNGIPGLRILDLHHHHHHHHHKHNNNNNTHSSPQHHHHKPLLPQDVETARLRPGLNQDYNATTVRFSISSPILPDITYEYNMTHRHLTELHRETLPSRSPTHTHTHTHTPAFQCHRLLVPTPDNNIQIPLTLAYHPHLHPSQNTHIHTHTHKPTPTLLQAYGAYGVPYDLSFRPDLLPLLHRGWLLAFAHVRGGGEMGKKWHLQGTKTHKHNSIDDFLGCVDYLLKEKWTQKGYIVGQGASAGALTVAGAVHRRPDLFGAMLLKVPFLDVVRTMTDPSLPLTVHEYDEWGNPNIQAHTHVQEQEKEKVLAALKAVSPYDSLDVHISPDKPLPPTHILASLTDHRVHYWEAAKYVAKARERCDGGGGGGGGESEILLRMEGSRGHESATAQTEMLQEAAYEQAFMISRLGLDQGEGEKKDEEQKKSRRRERGGRNRRRARYLGDVGPLVFW